MAFLFFDGTLYHERDYDIKNTLIFEGTEFTKWTMLLRPFLISKGHYFSKGL